MPSDQAGNERKLKMLGTVKRLLIPYLLRIPGFVEYQKQKRFRVEKALIAGEHHSDNQNPSILHFSFNKAATQYTKKILQLCAIENGMQPVDIHGYAFDSDYPFLDHLTEAEMQDYAHLFKPHGYLYSSFGGMIVGIPEFEKYRVILMIRDPRDILVSQYYSHAYSHAIPSEHGNKRESFMAKRLHTKGIDIDEYVIAECDRTLNLFLRYQELMLDVYPDICVLSYEEMASDFRTWLEKLLAGCGLYISTTLKNRLIEENERSRPAKEDVHSHVRQGKAGDYLNKLKPETIRHLDEKFAPILQAFGYK